MFETLINASAGSILKPVIPMLMSTASQQKMAKSANFFKLA